MSDFPPLPTIPEEENTIDWLNALHGLSTAVAVTTIVWLSADLSKINHARDAFFFWARVLSLVLVALALVGQWILIAADPCTYVFVCIGTWACLAMFGVIAVYVSIVAKNAPVDRVLFPLSAAVLILLYILTLST